MAAVYKALSRTKSSKAAPTTTNALDHPSSHTAASSSSTTTAKELRQRVLLLSSRGVTFRHRHLLNDLAALLPHSRKESKLDTKTKLYQLNELAELYNCNNVLFFEARKGKDLYCWMSKPPNGPTVKFHVQNLHTMDELHFTGNCLKGSRPILSFDASFDTAPHLRLIKELLMHQYGVPKGARKSKPFIDHVMAFTVAGGNVWVRTYQINESEGDRLANPVPEGGAHEDATSGSAATMTTTTNGDAADGKTTLIEIGPRFVLTPIVMLEGSFGGPVIFENKEFVSPNAIRSDLRRRKASKYAVRARSEVLSKARRDDMGLVTGGRKMPRDPLDDRDVFK